jgi:hypothetical protein
VEVAKQLPAPFAKQTDKRWKEIKNELPGPADYEVSIFKDYILKNLMLNLSFI